MATEITVYNDSNFKGKAKTYVIGRHLGDRVDNDQISSLKVPEGLQVTLYWDKSLAGKQLNLRAGDYPQLNDYGWNDAVSSLVVEKDDTDKNSFVTVYGDANYRGWYQKFPVGQYDIDKIAKSDAISSVKVPEGMVVQFYSDSKFQGKKQWFDESCVDLAAVGWGDKISSLEVKKNGYTLTAIEFHHLKAERVGNPEVVARAEMTVKINSAKADGGTEFRVDETVGWEVTNHWENSVMVGMEVSQSIEVGIPKIGQASASFTLRTENSYTWGESKTESGSTTYSTTHKVNAKEGSNVKAIATVWRNDVSIPYTATLELTKPFTNGDPMSGDIIKKKGTLHVKGGYWSDLTIEDI